MMPGGQVVGSCLHGKFQLVDARRGVDFQDHEDVPLRFRQLGALPEGAGGAGEGPDVDAGQLAAQFGPAEDDVGADAVLARW